MENYIETLLERAKTEQYFKSVTRYNTYLQFVYTVPELKSIKTAQWFHIYSIVFTENGYEITGMIFNNNPDLDIAVKYPILDINKG